ncbi:hypothetical protein Ancab_013691 [Ancistrocladus abbreviatus]
MCPLRFILVFFSAVLAGYFAWRTFRSSPEIDTGITSEDLLVEKVLPKDDKEGRNLKRVMNELAFFFFFFFNFLFLEFCVLFLMLGNGGVLQMVQDGFWVFVDMASGRYLWRNFKEMKKDGKVKSC